jgi:hypothetical protein
MNKRPAMFAAAFVVLVLFGSACSSRERDEMAEPSPTVAPAMTPPSAAPAPSASPVPEWLAAGATDRVEEITAAPKAFLGKTVTVVAKVDNIYNPRAFTLNGEDEAAPVAKAASPRRARSRRIQRPKASKDLLTLVPKVGGFPSIDAQWKDSKARVTGVVLRMAPEAVEREIGWVLPRTLESRFKGRPVLIVRSVERLAN